MNRSRVGSVVPRDVRWGKVLGLPNAGSVLGLWSRSVSGRASDAIYHGCRCGASGKMLSPGSVMASSIRSEAVSLYV
jgi:hypothetical protein